MKPETLAEKLRTVRQDIQSQKTQTKNATIRQWQYIAKDKPKPIPASVIESKDIRKHYDKILQLKESDSPIGKQLLFSELTNEPVKPQPD